MAIEDPLDFIGRGLITPFRRDQKQDFANSSGIDVIRSNVSTILNTTCASNRTQGEIPFNQKLGSLLAFLKHKNMDDETFNELALYYVVDALRRNESRVRVTQVRVIKNRKGYHATIKVTYNIVDAQMPQHPIIAPGQTEEVTL